MQDEAPEFIDVAGRAIAYRRRAGRGPGMAWLGGYRSDMTGSKAQALDGWAEETGRAFLRHDYSGHGQSGGDFADGTISLWLAESLAVLRHLSDGPQILVGSSMGAWIALRMVQELQKAGEGDRVAGLVMLAPAPDFTADLVEPKLTAAQKRALQRDGYFEATSRYGDGTYLYTRKLLEDGQANRVLTGPIDTHCPIHILQGMDDPDVPYAHALKLTSFLPSDDVTLSLIPGGDHRLSRSQDIALLLRATEAIIAQGSA